MPQEVFPYFDSELIKGFFPLALGIFLPIIITLLVTRILASAAIYLVRAISLYRMAKNLNFRYPVLAFVTSAEHYVFGKIADSRHGTVVDKHGFAVPTSRIFSISLLTMSLISVAAVIAQLVFSLLFLYEALSFAASAVALDPGSMSIGDFIIECLENGNFNIILWLQLCQLLSTLANLLRLPFRIVYAVAFYYILDMYEANPPLLWSILSVIFPITVPICLLIIKNKKPKRQKTDPSQA